ncbi:asparaginyl/glutamyl-tRNA amidotransferase subunit C [Candidatus Kuenenbacteria bacterium RIFCSPHIGHO2_02_FULL_39_13]|uniref:Aspartyl/glutamyl-tRNA(Asn/Gln) amidotransferase subunit C n=1 Tax=Candidatus Kuenenbacteria bacterium RIFCSPHIGHO2_02_FULL_39_13 TaxID=1798561 RepID=A0A1F6FNU3_9BACT|nr:MAG: asparaginyl/glutamyl-tRNA amidotransferase subunit C [Candidatus Kuenenbacteria bacterium RIFCSPHIGHO2_02_FULL_39_13]
MPLDIKQIEHIAQLARIELTTEEKQKFTKDLGDILDYFEKLKRLETTGIEPTSQIIGLKNISRADETVGCPEDVQKNILANAPNSSGRFIKVNKIM